MTQQSKIPANRINVEELQQSLGGGLELGDIGIAPFGIDETKNTRRYLNGQVISQIQFEAFTSLLKEKVLTYTNLSTTEENWQAEVTNSKLGQCGKFVIDDEAGTIRLPKVVNINGLQDLTLMGSIKAESLPNITGSVSWVLVNNNTTTSGAISSLASTSAGVQGSGADAKPKNITFNAHNSNDTYQDNASVQQEAVQYPYFIQVATGSEEAVNITTEIQLNNPFSLLDYKWSEYEITNASWLISNGTFHGGATYISVYELLQKIYNGTEIKEGVSVKLSTEEYTDYDFVLNTTESTFRLPIKVLLASGNRVAGNGMTLGLVSKNKSGNDWTQGLITVDTYAIGSNTAVYGTNYGTSGSQGAVSGKSLGVTTDATKSGIETSSDGLYLYFYVGETVQDANIIAASNVLTNAVMKNSSTDRETVVGWGMPDYSATISGVGNNYTAPSDGIFWFSIANNNGARNIGIIPSGSSQVVFYSVYNSYGTAGGVPVVLAKGDRIIITSGTTGLSGSYFVPMKGAK